MRTLKRTAFVLSVTALMLFAPLTGVTFVGDTVDPVGTAQADEVREVTDTISVWERSMLPFRAEAADGEPSVEVDNLELFLQDHPENAQNPANRETVKVFENGSDITLSYRDVSGADTSQFANPKGTRVKVVVGYLNESIDGTDPSIDDIPTTGGEVIDNLTQENLDNLNNNMTFSVHDETLNADGEIDGGFPYTPNDPGLYTAVVVKDGGDGQDVSVSDGDLSVNGNIDIIGVEQFAAQESTSSVNAPGSVEPGDDITFDVNATELSGTGSTTHAVVVYDEDAFTGSEMTLNQTAELSEDFSEENVTIEHEIESVNGVQNFDGDVEMFDVTLGERTESGTTQLQDIVSFLADETDRDEPGTEVTGDAITLDSSITVIEDANPDDELTVETYGNWTEGDYRWVHVAAGSSSDQIQSQTDTINIRERTSSGSSGSSSSDDDDDEPAPEPIPENQIRDRVTLPPEVTPVRATVSEATFNEETGTSTASFSEEDNTEEITFNGQVEGEVITADLDREPEETGPSPGRSVAVTQINVPEGSEDTPATIRMRVSFDRLEEIDADAEDLRVNRFNEDEGEWQGLETETVGETDTHVRLEAETPGFSYFAVSATSQPEAVIAAPNEINAGEEFTLDGSDSSDEYGEVVAYEWSVNGETLTGETVTTAIDEAGDAEIQLTVENDAGETDTETATVSVIDDSEPASDDGEPATDDGEPATDDEEPPADGLPGFGAIGLLVLFVIVIVAALLYMRYQNQDSL